MTVSGSWHAGLLLIGTLAVFLTCCAETPMKTETRSLILQLQAERVHKLALDILVTMGARIEKSEALYLEGFLRDRSAGPMYTRGDRIVIWMESLGPNETKVYVDTAREGVLLGKSNLRDHILNFIKKEAGLIK